MVRAVRDVGCSQNCCCVLGVCGGRLIIVRLLSKRTVYYYLDLRVSFYDSFANGKLTNNSSPNIRYFILFIAIIQIFIALYTMSSRGGTEAFISLWSSILLLLLCVGGTVIMRKFQNSVAVGFFMGSVVSASQMFFLIFLM